MRHGALEILSASLWSEIRVLLQNEVRSSECRTTGWSAECWLRTTGWSAKCWVWVPFNIRANYKTSNRRQPLYSQHTVYCSSSEILFIVHHPRYCLLLILCHIIYISSPTFFYYYLTSVILARILNRHSRISSTTHFMQKCSITT